jgi:hypothetical protein
MVKPNGQGVMIYKYETNFDSTTQQGFLKGEPVAVEYIGNDFKSVTISFPLYYMDQADAKELMEFILTNKFDEVMPVVNEESKIPDEYNLEQNFPNPFNPSTTIRYSLPEDSYVTLRIYNLLGEEVSTLINTQQKAGRYEINFDASQLASGVYIYRLEAANYTASKKLMLMK